MLQEEKRDASVEIILHIKSDDIGRQWKTKKTA